MQLYQFFPSNGHPDNVMVNKSVLEISSALAFISSTSQLAQIYFPFKNAASGDASHVMTDAGRVTERNN
jgi:hypothetical protein